MLIFVGEDTVILLVLFDWLAFVLQLLTEQAWFLNFLLKFEILFKTCFQFMFRTSLCFLCLSVQKRIT